VVTGGRVTKHVTLLRTVGDGKGRRRQAGKKRRCKSEQQGEEISVLILTANRGGEETVRRGQ